MSGHFKYRYLIVILKDDPEADWMAQVPVFGLSKEEYAEVLERLKEKYSDEKYEVKLMSAPSVRINVYENKP